MRWGFPHTTEWRRPARRFMPAPKPSDTIRPLQGLPGRANVGIVWDGRPLKKAPEWGGLRFSTITRELRTCGGGGWLVWRRFESPAIRRQFLPTACWSRPRKPVISGAGTTECQLLEPEWTGKLAGRDTGGWRRSKACLTQPRC